MRYISLTLFLAMCLCICCSCVCAVAYAEVDVFTNVLDDLHADESFDEADYPYKANDYSLQVITIAESTSDELFVYVYQPGGAATDVRASLIHLSQGKGYKLVDGQKVPDLSYVVHKLTYINSEGVFYKYKVNDFVIEDVRLRQYEISEICRPFIVGVDEPATGGNTITEVPFAVSKRFALGVEDGKFVAYSSDIQTIKITSKFVGFVRYPNGFQLLASGACDAHFVAFDTDRRIDELLEADVYFKTQSCTESYGGLSQIDPAFDGIKPNYVYLKNDQDVEFAAPGWFGKTYTWKRIQTVTDFVENVVNKNEVYSGVLFNGTVSNFEITENAKAELKNKKWVLCFAETPYVYIPGSTTYPITTISYTIVSDVSILRLQFKTNGKVYNLGVIDNHQSGSRDPINRPGGLKITPNNKGWNILALILGAIALVTIAVFVVKLVRNLRSAVVYKDYKRRKRK